MNIIKQLHINIHLIKALEYMSKYEKNFNDIISNKKKWEDQEKIKLVEDVDKKWEHHPSKEIATKA